MAQFIIGIIIVVLGVILTTVGGYVAKDGWEKMHHKKNESKSEIIQQDATGNDNIQAATTGDNSPIIGGDYVAGNKTVKDGPSLEDVEAAVRKALQEHDNSLRIRYGEKYSVAVITPDGFVIPKGEVPSGINVKWETGRVVHMSSERVQIVAPDIIVNTDHMKDGYISGNIFDLPKKIGAKAILIHAKDFSVVIEVIGIDQNLVIVGLGMAPID